MRASSSGPMSVTVARTGWPCAFARTRPTAWPGRPAGAASACRAPSASRRASAPSVPGWVMPVRSPLTSAMNTGTPRRLKFSASVCSVTVLPVPVAPVIRPWRLAIAGSRKHSMSSCLASRIGSAMGCSGIGQLRHGRSATARSIKIAAPTNPIVSAQARTHSWPVIPSGPTSSTARAARTKSAARSGPG